MFAFSSFLSIDEGLKYRPKRWFFLKIVAVLFATLSQQILTFAAQFRILNYKNIFIS